MAVTRSFMARLVDPKLRPRITKEMTEYMTASGYDGY